MQLRSQTRAIAARNEDLERQPPRPQKRPKVDSAQKSKRTSKAKETTSTLSSATSPAAPPPIPKSRPIVIIPVPQARRSHATLSTLPNEIQQVIYSYAIAHVNQVYRFIVGRGTSHNMHEHDITYTLLRVSKSVQDNLLEVVRMHGTSKLKAHVKSQLYMWAVEWSRECGLQASEADVEAKRIVDAAGLRVFAKKKG